MPANKKIVFLYTELAGYIEACLEELAATGYQVYCFAYPVNPEAPFQFSSNSKCFYFNRFDFSNDALKSKVLGLDPDLVVCSGWIDDGYLEVCKSVNYHVKKVIALDNKETGSLKSKLSLLRARFKFRSIFDYAWVPGLPQKAYAEKLGFDADDIFLGFYTADFERYSKIEWSAKKATFPKRFIYVGRYVEFKGVRELWNAFLNLNQGEWELYCAGQGQLFDKRTEGKGIHHLGFVQPSDLDKFVAEGGVFVLPSHKEPWGVVVHEFASAGFPMICSDQIGAASAFLNEGENGFIIPPKNRKLLAAAMQKMMNLSDQELYAFGAKSKELAGQITITDWLGIIKKILAKND